MSIPRVAVLGLMPNQGERIAKAIGSRALLRFAKDDTNPARMRSFGAWANIVVVTHFVSHKHTSVLDAYRVPYTVTHGGLGQITQTIEQQLEKYHEQTNL